jgi:hypothetical protein
MRFRRLKEWNPLMLISNPKRATINFDPQKVNLDDIKKAIRKVGYSTEIEEEGPEAQVKDQAETSATSEAEGKISETADIVSN